MTFCRTDDMKLSPGQPSLMRLCHFWSCCLLLKPPVSRFEMNFWRKTGNLPYLVNLNWTPLHIWVVVTHRDRTCLWVTQSPHHDTSCWAGTRMVLIHSVPLSIMPELWPCAGVTVPQDQSVNCAPQQKNLILIDKALGFVWPEFEEFLWISTIPGDDDKNILWEKCSFQTKNRSTGTHNLQTCLWQYFSVQKDRIEINWFLQHQM